MEKSIFSENQILLQTSVFRPTSVGL